MKLEGHRDTLKMSLLYLSMECAVKSSRLTLVCKERMSKKETEIQQWNVNLQFNLSD